MKLPRGRFGSAACSRHCTPQPDRHHCGKICLTDPVGGYPSRLRLHVRSGWFLGMSFLCRLRISNQPPAANHRPHDQAGAQQDDVHDNVLPLKGAEPHLGGACRTAIPWRAQAAMTSEISAALGGPPAGSSRRPRSRKNSTIVRSTTTSIVTGSRPAFR